MMLLLSQSQFGIDEVFVTKKNHDDNTRRQDSSQLYSPLLPPTALATTMTICPCCCLDLPLFSVFSTLFTDLIVLIHCPLIVLTMWVSLSVLLVAVVTYCGPHYPSSLSSQSSMWSFTDHYCVLWSCSSLSFLVLIHNIFFFFAYSLSSLLTVCLQCSPPHTSHCPHHPCTIQ